MGSVFHLIILLIAAGFAAPTWAEPPAGCPPGTLRGARALHFDPYQGTSTRPLPEWRLSEETEVRHLSDGAPGVSRQGNYGQVYLVQPPGEAPYALKVYWAQEEMKGDLDGLIFIRSRTPSGEANVPRFRVAVAEVGPNLETMKLSYVRGRELGNLLGDHRLPPALKKRLLDAYYERLDRLVMDLQSDARVVQHLDYLWGDQRAFLMRLYPRGSSELIDLNITPGQIIVDPDTLEMTIIDPH